MIQETALDLVRIAYQSADPPATAKDEVSELVGLDLEDLIALRNFVDRVVQAARHAKSAVDHRIAEELGPNGAIRYGDQFVRAAPRKTFKVTEPDALKDFVASFGKDGLDVFSMSSVKIGALKKLAEAKGLSPQAMVDSFGVYVSDDSAISIVPLDKAPQWAKKLEPGQRTFPRGKALEEVVQDTKKGPPKGATDCHSQRF